VIITRREFCEAALGLALVGVLASASGLVLPAFAEAPKEDLMAPGPLGEQAQGKSDAPITLIEYASMTCSHCANFAMKVYPELKSRYIDTGKVRYILREFPLDPVAAAGFMLARCVGDDKYFAMIDVLFKLQTKWAFVPNPKVGLLGIARQAGLPEKTFNECLANQTVLDGIEQVRQHAEKLGVESTPTFFINGTLHRGEITVDEMTKLFEPYLKNG